jgi:hypothetical protein
MHHRLDWPRKRGSTVHRSPGGLNVLGEAAPIQQINPLSMFVGALRRPAFSDIPAMLKNTSLRTLRAYLFTRFMQFCPGLEFTKRVQSRGL